MPLVTMPDGTVVQMPDNPDPALLARLKSFQAAQAAKPQDASPWYSKLLKGGAGIGESGLSVATGALAKPISDVAGLAAIPAHAAGFIDTMPADVKSAVQSGLTYQPQTGAGQAITGAIGKVGDLYNQGAQQIGGAVQKGANAVGLPQEIGEQLKDGTAEALNQVPNFMGAKAPAAGAARVANAADEAVSAAPRQAQIQQALDAGYHLPPTEVSGSPGGKLLTGVAGKVELNNAQSIANQEITNKIAKQEAGLSPQTPLSPATLAAQARRVGQAYDDIRNADKSLVPQNNSDGSTATLNGKPVVRPAGAIKPDDQFSADIAQIGADRANPDFGTKVDPQVQELKDNLSQPSTFTPAGALDKIKSLRSDSRALLKAADDPDKLALGRAKMQAANALEDQVSRYLDSTGQAKLYDQFTKARTQLAKINTIQDAISADGKVDASAINAYRNNGGHVEGGLKTIADAADSFPKVVRNTQTVQAPAPFSAFNYGLLASGAVPAELAGAHGAGAAGAGIAAMMAARPLARASLASDWYRGMQHGQVPQPGIFSQLAANPSSPLAGLAATAQADQSHP